MKVLWFCREVVASRCEHNGGGWVTALAESLRIKCDLKLGICFEGAGVWGECADGVTRYPMDVFLHRKNKLKRRFSVDHEEKLLLPLMLKAIADFQPDIIHVWGTEVAYGIICQHTKIPVILHLQGILTPYNNATYPPGFSKSRFLLHHFLHPKLLYKFFYFERVLKRRAAREIRIIQNCRNFLGRTDWDRAVVKLYHPEARYFYDSEMLRLPFMEHAGEWRAADHPEKVITSVISMPYYKGHDLILKTAELLATCYPGKFVWRVYGVYSMEFWEKELKIAASQVHVQVKGTLAAEALKDALLETDVFVHPSYIDNSPNSLCEAQLLGLPVIATSVGGVPSLIENDRDGLLVPANDPWTLANRIIALFDHPEVASRLGQCAAETAKCRHDPARIVDDLLGAYHTVISENE